MLRYLQQAKGFRGRNGTDRLDGEDEIKYQKNLQLDSPQSNFGPLLGFNVQGPFSRHPMQL